MAAAIGWYGPLIDLCKADSHVGDYVQLLVFVHKATPIQYKLARNGGGEVVRMDVLVGDETRSYFPLTIWQKQLGSDISAGHVFLIQNVKITRFGDSVEARALHCSSLQCVIRPNDFVSSKGIDEVIQECRVGITTRDKLQKLVGWLQRARLTHCGSLLNYFEHGKQVKVNWKVHEEIHSQDCSSLSELCHCENSSKATFHANIGEIFLPINWIDETEAERMFISRRLQILGDNNLVDDLITTGCQQCGAPLNARTGSTVEQDAISLYCQRSSNRLHVIGSIYRPFLLYVWDDLKYLPICVTNKAAELLFGNIPAEKVYSSFKSQLQKQPRMKEKNQVGKNPNFYKIWLILLKMMFQHGKNSPLKFKATVDTAQDWENGRLKMVSISFPVFGRTSSA